MARRMTSTAASFDGSDGAKPPSSPCPVAWPSSWRIERSAQKTSEPGPQRVGEGVDADRHDHELLEVGRVLGVLAAVEDVEHRDRQRRRADAAEVAVQRQVVRRGRRVGAGERDAEDRVGAERALVRRAVELAQQRVDAGLVGGVEPVQRRADRVGHVGDRAEDALAAEAGLVAVAQLDRLVGAGRGAGRDGRAADRRRRPGRRRPRPSGCRANRGSRARRRRR